MLHNYERGYAVMNEDLTAYSFESPDINTCKRYCRKGDVVIEKIPYVCGKSFSITWRKHYWKPFYFKPKYREANIFYLHLRWNNEYAHKNGKIRHRG